MQTNSLYDLVCATDSPYGHMLFVMKHIAPYFHLSQDHCLVFATPTFPPTFPPTFLGCQWDDEGRREKTLGSGCYCTHLLHVQSFITRNFDIQMCLRHTKKHLYICYCCYRTLCYVAKKVSLASLLIQFENICIAWDRDIAEPFSLYLCHLPRHYAGYSFFGCVPPQSVDQKILRSKFWFVYIVGG